MLIGSLVHGLLSVGAAEPSGDSAGLSSITLVNIAAILLSPVIAVLVTLWLSARRQVYDRQLQVLLTLFGNRHRPISNDTVQALSVIDVVFAKNERVRRLWREYFEMLGNAGLGNPSGWAQRDQKLRELIHAMAQSLGFRGKLDHHDTERIYVPEGMGRQDERSEAIANELLRVLKASGGLSVSPKPPDS